MGAKIKNNARAGTIAGFKIDGPETASRLQFPKHEEGPPPDYSDQYVLRPIKAHTVGVIPESDYNPEIVYTKSGPVTAAVTLLTFLLMRKEVTDVVKSTGKPVICSEMLDEDLWRSFANAYYQDPLNERTGQLPVAAKGSHKKYIGYANFEGPIAVAQTTRKRLPEINGRNFQYYSKLFEIEAQSPNTETEQKHDLYDTCEEDKKYKSLPFHASDISIQCVLDAQYDFEALKNMMRRVQKVKFLRRIPSTLCHEIGHQGRNRKCPSAQHSL